ncbi:cupin [Cellulomonas sp. HZM]|uniref:cupin n=1 Tax=Cellulomonas sp. HZM TaxID=1454010 RepID=UPI000493A70F|nr:cupin [Cellulomonas sp. HZM]
MTDLTEAVRTQLEAARASAHGRDAQLVAHDGVLRQTVLALTAGSELGEHNSPHAASLQVLTGRVRVTGLDESEVAAGHLVVLTHERHAVLALEDSVFLLTTVTSLDADQRTDG